MKIRMKVVCWSGFFRTKRNEVFSEFWNLDKIALHMTRDSPPLIPRYVIMFNETILTVQGFVEIGDQNVWHYDFNKDLKLKSSSVSEVSIQDENGRVFLKVCTDSHELL